MNSLRTIANSLNLSHIGKKLLSEVTTLLQIYFTNSITTATEVIFHLKDAKGLAEEHNEPGST